MAASHLPAPTVPLRSGHRRAAQPGGSSDQRHPEHRASLARQRNGSARGPRPSLAALSHAQGAKPAQQLRLIVQYSKRPIFKHPLCNATIKSRAWSSLLC